MSRIQIPNNFLFERFLTNDVSRRRLLSHMTREQALEKAEQVW